MSKKHRLSGQELLFGYMNTRDSYVDPEGQDCDMKCGGVYKKADTMWGEELAATADVYECDECGDYVRYEKRRYKNESTKTNTN